MNLTKVTYSMIQDAPIDITNYGAVGDGTTDDTAAIQAAVNAAGSTSNKRVKVPYGASGVYKITNAIFINTGGITIEFDNPNIKFKKFYNGAVIVVNAGQVDLINVGIDGNAAAGYTGAGIYYNDATHFTFNCSVINPYISNTQDSCIMFKGPRGGAGILIQGGALTTYNPTGASSGGYPSIRLNGAQDGDVSNRTIIGVTSSSQPLIDVTGMWVTKISNCFCGTMFFGNNPFVTGLPIAGSYHSTETFIDNTYIRDGLLIDYGNEIVINNSLSHGNAPTYASPVTTLNYGGVPTGSSTYGWVITANSLCCNLGASNRVSNRIQNLEPNGVSVGNQSSIFECLFPFNMVWTGASANPVLGNGTNNSTYDYVYKDITYNLQITTGSTTTFGTGQWYFALPFWSNTLQVPIGSWSLYRPGIGTTYGEALVTSTGSQHKISLLDSSGNYLGSTNPASMPTGSVLTINVTYSRG